MTAECTQVGFEFQSLNHRQIRAQFDGGAISSDGGGLLLREVDKRTGIIGKFAACFTDYRDPERIEHRLEELVAQRVYGLALGYEDLNDHDQLRNDPLLAVLVEKSDPSQEVLPGKSTLNRLELTPATATAEARYKKIVLDHGAVDRLLVDLFLEAHGEAPQQHELRGHRLAAGQARVVQPAQARGAQRHEEAPKLRFGQVQRRALAFRRRLVQAEEAVEIVVLGELHAFVGAAVHEAAQVLLDPAPGPGQVGDGHHVRIAGTHRPALCEKDPRIGE